MPFMAQYYVIHEYENLQVGFVPFTGSAKSIPQAVTQTLTYEVDTGLIGTGCDTIAGMPIWGFALLIVASAAILGGGIWAAFVFCYLLVFKGKRSKKRISAEEKEEIIDLLVKKLKDA